MSNFTLTRNAFGKLVLSDANGAHEGVVPVRAFPIASPDKGISIVDGDGHELAWLDSLADLPAAERALLEEELKNREFLPEIKCIRHVSTFAVPSTWEVETDRGVTSFVLKGEEDIRRIGQARYLVADSHGVQYLVRSVDALDKASRKMLDRFL